MPPRPRPSAPRASITGSHSPRSGKTDKQKGSINPPKCLPSPLAKRSRLQPPQPDGGVNPRRTCCSTVRRDWGRPHSPNHRAPNHQPLTATYPRWPGLPWPGRCTCIRRCLPHASAYARPLPSARSATCRFSNCVASPTHVVAARTPFPLTPIRPLHQPARSKLHRPARF